MSVLKLKRLWLLLCLPVAAVLLIAAQSSSEFSEWYATSIYPSLSKSINFITSLVPFSIAEILLYAVVLFLLFYIISRIVRLVRSPGKRKKIAAKIGINLGCTVSILFLAFTLCCGINYHRYSFAETSGLPIRDSSRQELIDLCTHFAEQANLSRDKAAEGGENGQLNWGSLSDAAWEAKESFDTLCDQYPLLLPGYGTPKSVLASRLMSYIDITGIFFPFTFEANVNTDIPGYLIPHTMGHELAHLRGFMREDEANFIGYLVCKNSDNPMFQYSGNLQAFIYANNALYALDPEAQNQVWQTLSPGVVRDIQINSAYWKQFEGPISDFSSSVNDAYLKANNQKDGVKSYGRVVDLLLAEYRQEQQAS